MWGTRGDKQKEKEIHNNKKQSSRTEMIAIVCGLVNIVFFCFVISFRFKTVQKNLYDLLKDSIYTYDIKIIISQCCIRWHIATDTYNQHTHTHIYRTHIRNRLVQNPFSLRNETERKSSNT